MADEGVSVSMVLPSIVPTVVPMTVQAVSSMLSDSRVRIPDGWKQLDVYESCGSDGWEADSNVGGGLSCKDGVHALYTGGDQVDHFWVALGDDDFRHRRRGRGDQGTILMDYLDRRVSPVHQIDLVDQFDEFMEEDSVAYAIEFGDVGRSCHENDVLLREFEVDVQSLQAELSHLAVGHVGVCEEEDLHDFDSSSDVLGGSVLIEDGVSSSVCSMGMYSRTDLEVVGCILTSSPTSSLINTELINSFMATEWCVVNRCDDGKACTLDMLTPVRSPSVGLVML
jgi:hypothetical protein